MDQLIIFAVLFSIIIIIAFVGYRLIVIGAKNAKENNNRTIVRLTHGDIFKFETQLNAKLHTKIVEYLETHDEPFSGIAFEFLNEPKNEF